MDSKRFYRVVPFILAGVSCFTFYRGHAAFGWAAGGFCAFLVVLRLASASAADAFYRLYSGLLTKLGELLTKLFMIVFFYVIFAPYGLLVRALQGDALKRRLEPVRDSYWIHRPKPTEKDDKACENPY